MEYKLIRSNRQTLAISIMRDNQIVVRAPLRMPLRYIEEFIAKSRTKIETIVAKRTTKLVERPLLSNNEIAGYIAMAGTTLPTRVAELNIMMSMPYNKVKISHAQGYWGCCNRHNDILLNWRLMLVESELIDYVIIHELAHVKFKGHGKDYWTEVAKFSPNYKALRRRLNQRALELF